MKIFQYSYYPSGQLEPVIAVCQAENRDEALKIFSGFAVLKADIPIHGYNCTEIKMNDYGFGTVKLK